MNRHQRRTQTTVACHKQIADVAKEMAAHAFEVLMGQDKLWTLWKEGHPNLRSIDSHRRVFIRSAWSGYIGPARATLAELLRGDIKTELKEEIHEALLLDATLKAQRAAPPQLVGAK